MAGTLPTDEARAGDLDFATDAVPATARMSKFSLTMAWWGVCSAVFYIVVSATLALSYGTKNVLIAIALSVISYGVINSVLSRFSIRTGLSVAGLSKTLFGSAGAALAALIFSATATYYAIFEGSVIAVALHNVFPSLGYAVAAAIVVGYSVPLIFGSVQHWLDKLNGVLLPVYLLGLLATGAVAIYEYGYSDAWLSFGASVADHPYGWIDCFVAYMGVWVLMMFTMDFARFGKVEDVSYHSNFNFGIPFYLVTFALNGVFGLFIAGTVPTDGAVSEVSVVLAILKLMGFAGLLFVWATQTRINTANFHLATVNLESFFALTTGFNPGKIVWAIIIGLIVYGLMLANVFSYILQALAYQGIFVVAWVAIALVHILTNSKTLVSAKRAFDMRGLASWALGAAAGIAAMHSTADIARFSAPITAVVAATIYFASRTLVSRKQDRATALPRTAN